MADILEREKEVDLCPGGIFAWSTCSKPSNSLLPRHDFAERKYVVVRAQNDRHLLQTRKDHLVLGCIIARPPSTSQTPL